MTNILKLLFSCLTLLTLSLPASGAEDNLDLLGDLGLGGGQSDILSPDEAFVLSTDVDSTTFSAFWRIADGHYLYKDKISITVDDPSVKAGTLNVPGGEEKLDPVFNKKLYVYHDEAKAFLNYQYTESGVKDVVFKVKYQGCSEVAGICYPPQTKKITVSLPAPAPAMGMGMGMSTDPVNGIVKDANPPAEQHADVSEQDRFANILRGDSTWLIILAFFTAGLLLAFTPCVFPMIPILSGIIVGQGENISTKKAFLLSLIYVLAMAVTYTVVGVLVGLSGENIQAWFQNPWIISTFVLIFIALSFSMFGFYDLQMPSSIQSKLTEVSNSQEGGNVVGVAIMGFLSALIVGPCVTGPLVGALIVIAENGDKVIGGLALFSLSMGMGAPLLVIGTSAGKILPRAGMWMDAVKAVFGVLLLGLGIWLLERVAPAAFTMFLWAALVIVSAIYMGAIDALPEGSSGWRKLWKGLGILLLAWGLAMLIGLASGNRDIFQPLKGFYSSANSTSQASSAKLVFRKIKGVDGLNQALAEARQNGQAVMLDFYADWCVSCKEMEAFTFSDPEVQNALKDVMLLKADVTANDDQDTALYKHFGIIGPPSIMFFDRQGNEMKHLRVVGFMPADKFLETIRKALA